MNRAISWFEDLPTLDALPAEEAILKLRSVGEDEVADALEDMEQETSPTLGFRNGMLKGRRSQDKPWLSSNHVFGYLAPIQVSNGRLPVRSLNTIPADKTLKKARIKISLERLRIASYPGGGVHRVLFHFAACHHAPGQSEWVRFNATYRVREGEHASIRGCPIFIGLDVGNEGLSFKCGTINVKNEQDEAFLDYLESDVFKAGLKLASTVQPLIVPFSEMARSLAEVIGKRNRNIRVQDFELSLDFTNVVMREHLAEGTYLVVQVPENSDIRWNWNDWRYDPTVGQIVHVSTLDQFIPFNYIVFSISRYEEA